MVLTDEQKQTTYPAATLEDGAIATEGTYYSINTSNIASNPPTLPNTYQNNNGNPPYNNNPSSDKTATSQKMYELSGSGDKTGLAITLRVMAGDNINILGKSFWHLNNAQTISNNNNIVDGLTDFITAFASSPLVRVTN